jgi:hypothetical protein
MFAGISESDEPRQQALGRIQFGRGNVLGRNNPAESAFRLSGSAWHCASNGSICRED